MITITFTPTSKNASLIRGILIKREGIMAEVAWDEVPDRPASIGWINLSKNKVSMKSNESFRWINDALKNIFSGNIEEGRRIIAQQEEARRLERLRKEHAI